jgi:hypothetical protein
METFSSKTYWQVRVVAVQGGRQEWWISCCPVWLINK